MTDWPPEHPPTRREGGARPPQPTFREPRRPPDDRRTPPDTYREPRRGNGVPPPPPPPPGTMREAADDPEESLTRLPSALRLRYRMVGELESSGGEAHLLRVECTAPDGLPGTRRVVKVYKRGLTLDHQALARVKAMDRDHVIGLVEWGQSDGHWYEVQEHIEGGDLYELRNRQNGFDGDRVHQIVIELVGAVHGVHEAGVLHKDVKPANILVRRDHPLDLVLCDFGLAIAANLSMHYVSRSRTPQYASPEVFLNTYYKASDWWSVGVCVAELALGRHPLADLHELAFGTAIRERPIDLDGIVDERLRMLCRALLIPDHTQRWGWEQIEEWLAGGSPRIPDWSAVHYRIEGFEFRGRHHTDPVELARALGAAWVDTARLVRGGPLQTANLKAFLAQFATHHRVAALLDDWDDQGVAPDVRVAQLLVALDPELPFVPFRDVDVSEEGLAQLAGEVLREGSHSANAATLTDLQQHGILQVYGTLQGRESLADIDRRWGATERQALQVLAVAGRESPSAEILLALKAQALLVSGDAGAARRATVRARWVAWVHGRNCTWLRPLRRRLGQAGYAIAVVSLEDEIRGTARAGTGDGGARTPDGGGPAAAVRTMATAFPARIKAVALCCVMVAAALYSTAVAMALEPTQVLEIDGARVGRGAAAVAATWLPYLVVVGALVIVAVGRARLGVTVVGGLALASFAAGAGAFDSVDLPLRNAVRLPAGIERAMVDLGAEPGENVVVAAGISAGLALVMALLATSVLAPMPAGPDRAGARRTFRRQQAWLAVLTIVGLAALAVNTASRFDFNDGGSDPGEVPVNAWMAQLGSLRVSDGMTVRDAMLTEVRASIPETKVLVTDDYSSLSPGFWVLFLPQAFSSGSDVIAWCDAHGRTTNDDCYAAYVSHSTSDKGRYCVRKADGSLEGEC